MIGTGLEASNFGLFARIASILGMRFLRSTACLIV